MARLGTWTAWSKICARVTFTIRWSSPATSNRKRSSASSAFPPNSAPTPPGPSSRNPPEYARKILREAGWDEKTPVLVLCPIHPFVWPVKASIAKYIARVTTGAYKESQYRTVYFHESGPEVDSKYRHYISGFGKAAAAFCQRHRVFPILVAMERLDAVACRSMLEFLPGTPIFTSDDYNMFELVSILRAGSYMVSSRYHGIVTCMPSLVASAGVTMDERIRNLMRERGHEHLFLTVEDPDLETKLLQVMETLVCRSRYRPRRHRPHGNPQPEGDGPHGHDPRRRRPSHLPRIPPTLRRPELGRLFAATKPNTLLELVERYDTSPPKPYNTRSRDLTCMSTLIAIQRERECS